MAKMYKKRFESDYVFDCQRSPAFPQAGKKFTASGLRLPCNCNEDELRGRYFQFSEAQKDDTVTLNLVNKNGSIYKEISSGAIYGLGDGNFLYVGGSSLGYIFLSDPIPASKSVTYTPKIGKATNDVIVALLDMFA